MRQTVLSEPPEKTKKSLRRATLYCVLLAAAVLGINLLLTLRVTKVTYLPFLLINIVSDIAAGCVIVFWQETLKKRRILLRLAEQKGQSSDCRVAQVSEASLRYLDLDCFEVKADSRTLFLPCGTMHLEAGRTYRLQTVSNVITEAEG